MIKLTQAVIVEGKYDKITLDNIIDATIIQTNGFGIFKDNEKRNLIRTLALKRGIIIMTDADSAGNVIRSHLKQICPDGDITNVYIPQLLGKEKRKNKHSKEGYLGVEGMPQEIILKALERSGITGQEVNKRADKKITKVLLFKFGLSGGKNSSFLRDEFAQFAELPKGMSANAFLDCLNAVFSYDDFIKAVEIWQKAGQDEDKK